MMMMMILMMMMDDDVIDNDDDDFSPYCFAVNVALQGTAFQSGINQSSAAYAIDGRRDTCQLADTGGYGNPWWAVNLRAYYLISSVNITSISGPERMYCISCQAQNVYTAYHVRHRMYILYISSGTECIYCISCQAQNVYTVYHVRPRTYIMHKTFVLHIFSPPDM